METQETAAKPAFARFRPACKKHDIGATTAYELVEAGLLATFKIGGGTYIRLSEFDELPKRLADPEARKRLEAVKRAARKAA